MMYADIRPTIATEEIHRLDSADLSDLCDATEAAIFDGGGFGWIKPPDRFILEQYWRGVLLIPERELYVGRLDGVIAASLQLVRPPRNSEAAKFRAEIQSFFVAPWARGHGLARLILATAEARAAVLGFDQLNLDVRETQTRAIEVYEANGWIRWGTNPRYAQVGDRMLTGFYYYKILTPLADKSKPQLNTSTPNTTDS
ncbi:MAG: GNAT family N-acetyltransferase [Alphaproteobacteria bacterium]